MDVKISNSITGENWGKKANSVTVANGVNALLI
jgi:hypothetical protein